MYIDSLTHLSFDRFVEVADDLQLELYHVLLTLVVLCLVLHLGIVRVAARLL